MWSDTLQGLERGHLIRVFAWAAGSVLTGSLVFAWIVVRARAVPLLKQFAAQTIMWGMLELVVALYAWSRLVPRDYAGALALENILWLRIGLDAGCSGIGLTLALASYRLGPRLGGVGAGIGIVVQGAALLLLDAQLLMSLSQTT